MSQQITASDPLTKKVLLIGWDAADWKMIHPLIEKGWMPTLKRFMDEGVWGNIATLNPILSPMLWTSIASGKRPYKHGIHGFIEPMTDGKGVRPSSSTTRTCKAVWNILTQQGYKTHQVGWFCSHPAEPINGVYVTNMYDRISTLKPDEWKLPDECIHPKELVQQLGELRLHPTELDASHILPFIPNAKDIDQDKDRRLTMFAKLLCEMVNLHTATTWIMENRDWDFIGTYNPAIDHFCHGFMQYHPPRMNRIREKDFEIYKDVIVGCYRFHDMMLARMLELAGDDATVIICSDHGFHSDHLRPAATPREPAGPAVWHREYGILAMKGPGIKQGERVYGGSVLDVTPTVLSLFGLPSGADMDGKPLIQAFEEPIWPQRIDSWEDVDGPAGMHPKDKREDPFEAREAVQQLVELGYIEKPDENQERAAGQAKREADYNLARAYLDGGLANEAIELLEDLAKENPDQLRFGLNLAQCYLATKRRDDARRVVEDVLTRAEKQTDATVDRLEKRREMIHKQARWQSDEAEAIAQGRAESSGLFRYVERGDQKSSDETAKAHDAKLADAQAEDADQSPPSPGSATGEASPPPKPVILRITPKMLERADRRINAMQRRLGNLDVRVTPRALLLAGVLEYYDRNIDKALEYLQLAEKAEPRLPGLHNQIGRVYLRMKQPDDALRAFKKALEIDGDSSVAHDGMAAALLRLGKPTAAAEHALIAVGLLHHFPRAHYRLGVALTRLKMYEPAIEAFETCIKIAPRAAAPHRRLAHIYSNRLNRPDLAAEHLNKVEFIRSSRNAAAT